MSEKQLFTVGKVANTHGIRGELKIVPQTDFAEERFAKGSKLILQKEDGTEQVPVEVLASRLQKNVYVIKLKDYDNINDVEKYKGWLLKIAGEDRAPLEEGEYYYSDIVGCRVVTVQGEELGVISEILSPGANDVWVVDQAGHRSKQILLPVIDEVILDVNIAEKLIKVELMEGLI
ncbi:ribosome maturation factor RimM [Paenibacillus protaetiae]|uniref:Ribosome maturation factor RimM n=1 Tax=Paenibacillus protaetiae TaxID=2509456 RepID=A0A4P6EV90_9BACL|nr:ribosome maturation factor RimM [Paenibacillus protaetiae]QAY65579.1 ribosome maturation factor RimM [Paenibacillus protaetiae]